MVKVCVAAGRVGKKGGGFPQNSQFLQNPKKQIIFPRGAGAHLFPFPEKSALA
jgi:hypothetical protein